jgi:cysteine desulfurase
VILRNFFDYAATTPCANEVVRAMRPFWQSNFGNSNSRNHKYGWVAESALETARAQIANLINANANEIIFTSGATESNNLAIKGFLQHVTGQKKIISCVTEHKCVIETLRSLREGGVEVILLPVNSEGLLDLDLLRFHLPGSSLVTIAYVNNETGVMQNMSEISALCRAAGVALHTDAAQAFGKIPIDARQFDLISISAHKIYGPKGIGALFVSKKPRIRLTPLFHGGGQERGMRSGTQPVPLCVGFGAAAELASQYMQTDWDRAVAFSDLIKSHIVDNIENISINGSNRIPHILNLNIPCIEGESLMARLHRFALASGSACTSKSLEPSHVISAMHPEEVALANSSLRICFGRYTTNEDIHRLINALKKNIHELRAISPLWDMHKQGIDLKTIKWQTH